MKILIESVRKYPCLWQVDLPEYKDNAMKEAAWRAVFNECCVFSSVQQVKKLWKNLRDGHRQVISKKRKPTGQVATPIVKWKYEDQMEFLLPIMKNRPRQSNMQAVNHSLVYEDRSSEESLSRTQLKKNETIHSILEKEQKKREKKAIERVNFRQQILESYPNTLATNNLANFFLCMSEMTSEFPGFLQMRVQRQIFNIVMETKENLLMNNSTPESFPSESVTEHVNVTGNPNIHRFSARTPLYLQRQENDTNSSPINSTHIHDLAHIVSPAPASTSSTSPTNTVISPSQDSQSSMDVRDFMANFDFSFEP